MYAKRCIFTEYNVVFAGLKLSVSSPGTLNHKLDSTFIYSQTSHDLCCRNKLINVASLCQKWLLFLLPKNLATEYERNEVCLSSIYVLFYKNMIWMLISRLTLKIQPTLQLQVIQKAFELFIMVIKIIYSYNVFQIKLCRENRLYRGAFDSIRCVCFRTIKFSAYLFGSHNIFYGEQRQGNISSLYTL